jgi:nucleoid DNA-binding protein
MKVTELVTAIKADADAPGKLLSIPDPKAAALLRAAFAEIRKQIEAAGTEPLQITTFGTFQMVKVPYMKDGQKVMAERIHFRPAPKKS